jgi:hypothetical protein
MFEHLCLERLPAENNVQHFIWLSIGYCLSKNSVLVARKMLSASCIFHVLATNVGLDLGNIYFTRITC